jgi:hypothetical protein
MLTISSFLLRAHGRELVPSIFKCLLLLCTLASVPSIPLLLRTAAHSLLSTRGGLYSSGDFHVRGGLVVGQVDIISQFSALQTRISALESAALLDPAAGAAQTGMDANVNATLVSMQQSIDGLKAEQTKLHLQNQLLQANLTDAAALSAASNARISLLESQLAAAQISIQQHSTSIVDLTSKSSELSGLTGTSALVTLVESTNSHLLALESLSGESIATTVLYSTLTSLRDNVGSSVLISKISDLESRLAAADASVHSLGSDLTKVNTTAAASSLAVAALSSTFAAQSALLTELRATMDSSSSILNLHSASLNEFQLTLQMQSSVLTAITSINSSNLAGTVANLQVQSDLNSANLAALSGLTGTSMLVSTVSSLSTRLAAAESLSGSPSSLLFTTLIALRDNSGSSALIIKVSDLNSRVAAAEGLTGVTALATTVSALRDYSGSSALVTKVSDLSVRISAAEGLTGNPPSVLFSTVSGLGSASISQSFQLRALSSSNATLYSAHSALTTRVDASEAATLSLSSSVALHSSQLGALQTLTSTHSIQIAALQAANGTRTSDAGLSTRVSVLESNLTALSFSWAAQADAQQSLISLYSSQIAALQAANSTVMNKIVSGQVQQNSQGALISSQGALISSHGAMIASLQAANSSAQVFAAALSSRLAIVETSSAILTYQASMSAVIQQQLSDQVTSLQTSNVSVQTLLATLTARVTSLEGLSGGNTALVMQHSTQIASQALQVTSLQSSNVTLFGAIAQESARMSLLTLQLTALITAPDVSVQIAALQSANVTLSARLSAFINSSAVEGYHFVGSGAAGSCLGTALQAGWTAFEAYPSPRAPRFWRDRNMVYIEGIVVSFSRFQAM